MSQSVISKEVFLSDLSSGVTYPLDTYAAFGYTVTGVYGIQTSSGSVTAALQINGTDISGLSDISVNSTPRNVAATGGNNVSVGNALSLVFTSPSTPQNIQFTLAATRTNTPALANIQIFNSTGEYVPTEGISSFVADGIGGGGGGGGALGSPTDGSAGGTTSVGAVLSASGGEGGTGNADGSVFGGEGGDGGTGLVTLRGAPGEPAITFLSADGNATGGAGGDGLSGAGAGAGTLAGNAGSDAAANTGAGGGGAAGISGGLSVGASGGGAGEQVMAYVTDILDSYTITIGEGGEGGTGTYGGGIGGSGRVIIYEFN